jgi:hypothetical protein
MRSESKANKNSALEQCGLLFALTKRECWTTVPVCGYAGVQHGQTGEQMFTFRKTVVGLTLAAGLIAQAVGGAAPARAYSETVRKACAPDYASLCSRYKQNSTQLRRCFESNRRILSDYCIQALVKAGEVPARYLRR